jgi:hypothetical protein
MPPKTNCRLFSLSPEDLETLAQIEPAFVFDYLPWFMCSNFPKWVSEFEPLWMSENFPSYMFEYRMDWMCEHAPSKVFLYKPGLLEKKNKLWLIKHKKDYISEFCPTLLGEFSQSELLNSYRDIKSKRFSTSYLSKLWMKVSIVWRQRGKEYNPFIPNNVVEALKGLKEHRLENTEGGIHI